VRFYPAEWGCNQSSPAQRVRGKLSTVVASRFLQPEIITGVKSIGFGFVITYTCILVSL
jgi:hypothetical protein